MALTKSLALLLGVGLFFLVSYLFLPQFSRCPVKFDKSIQTLPGPINSRGFQKALREASTKDRIVILTLLHTVEDNPALELLILSFQLGEGTARFLNHLIVLVPDSQIFHVCKSIHHRCYNIANSRQKPIISSDRVSVEWRRNMIIQEAIDSGYHLIYTDVDVLWFRNPFPLISNQETIVMAPRHTFNSTNEMQLPHGGFFYMHANSIGLEFIKLWNFKRILHPESDAQSILDMIIASRDEFLFIRKNMSYLDKADYGDFCQGSIDLSRVYIANVNCSSGRERAIQDAELLLDGWRTLMNKQHQRITAE